jgi:hypothetical protein
MHMHFDFSASQILWTLTFAAQLVLLVVLLGRDHARRYPWFTAAIALSALRLMAEVLLVGRMATYPLRAILFTLSDLSMIAGLLVVVEVARRAFAGAERSQWIVNAAGLLTVAGGVLAMWEPWPVWKQLLMVPAAAPLNMMLVVAAPADSLMVFLGVDKGDLFVNLLVVQMGLLVVFLGRRFKAPWRSHTQMIAIGLSTVAIAWLTVQAAWEIILRTTQVHDRAEHQHLMALGARLLNADSVVYLAALVWWIAWLWLDEPGTPQTAAAYTAPEQTES